MSASPSGWLSTWLSWVSHVDRQGFPGQNEGMSVVEDIRQVLQDFLTPELRAVAAKFEAIESKIDAVNIRISSLEKAMDTRFSAAEEKANVRQEMILVQFERIANQLDVDKRLLRLESQRENSLAKSA
jgi:hypothetical protein